jgi:hypothetical protein
VRLTEPLALEEIRPSIGTVGDANDNALMEAINGLYKAECIRTTVFHGGPYQTIADEYATAGWVDWSTTDACTGPWETSRPSSTSRPTTLPSTESAPRIGTGENLGRFTQGLAHRVETARDRRVLLQGAPRQGVDGSDHPGSQRKRRHALLVCRDAGREEGNASSDGHQPGQHVESVELPATRRFGTDLGQSRIAGDPRDLAYRGAEPGL